MSCVRSCEGGFQVVYPFDICGPVNSELSMTNRIRLSKFRFTVLYVTRRQRCTRLDPMHPCICSPGPWGSEVVGSAGSSGPTICNNSEYSALISGWLPRKCCAATQHWSWGREVAYRPS